MDTPIPQGFIHNMSELTGSSQADALCRALDSAPMTAIRLNPFKSTDVSGKVVDWCVQGRILDHRPQFTLMPQWHAGCFYVQEPASMIISEVVIRLCKLIDRKDIRYLDMCAAPGGKTTAALAALPPDAFVTANEYVRTRANILVENLSKWGYPNTAVSCGDTSAYRALPETFDIVAVDAPCSGEGMMRKDAQARAQWSPALIEQCASTQRDIITNAWTALRPGGYLIYSTCTFNKTENEDILRFAMQTLGAESVDLNLNNDFNIPTSLDPEVCAMRFMPHLTAGEGLFMGVLHKPGSFNSSISKKTKSKKGKSTSKHDIPTYITNLLAHPDSFTFANDNTLWRATPAAHQSLVNELREHLYMLSCGLALGELKGKNFVPDTALALSSALRRDAYPSVETDMATALNYLRRESITLPADAPKGFVLLTFESHPLGFVKNLGNRANNLYPQAWRIRNL